MRGTVAKKGKRFLADTFAKQHIQHGHLSVHADHGGPMIAKPVAFLLADLGVPSRTPDRT